jgi:hypothetical protein
MSVEKKEEYLKKRRDYYHKRKANMEACVAAEGLHLDSSKANPRVINMSTQLAQPSNQVSEITDSRLVQTPMYMSQQCTNQIFQTPTINVSQMCSNQLDQVPMDVSQLTSNHML